jgi:hypothetical protein
MTVPAPATSMVGVTELKLTGIELTTVELPLVAPFRTSFATETMREALLLRVVTSEGEGWGECVAAGDPAGPARVAGGEGDPVDAVVVGGDREALQRQRVRRHRAAGGRRQRLGEEIVVERRAASSGLRLDQHELGAALGLDVVPEAGAVADPPRADRRPEGEAVPAVREQPFGPLVGGGGQGIERHAWTLRVPAADGFVRGNENRSGRS